MKNALQVIAVAAALAAPGAPAQTQDVPLGIGLLVMLKVVTYDSHFAERPKGDFVVLVPYDGDNAGDALTLAKDSGKMETRRISDRTLVFEASPIEELEARLVSRKASAVLLPRKLTGSALSTVLASTARARVYTLSFDEEQLKAGAMVGVILANGRPKPLVNVGVARKSGVEFSPSLLRLARVVP